MPKHKPKRGSPTIDMTAMCDVAFLLLTFFMLTAKAKPQESVVVDTPSSISETKLPESNTFTMLVSKEGNVYIDMAGQHTRKRLIDETSSQFQLGLTEEEKMKFANSSSFGVSRAKLKQWLNTEPAQRNQPMFNEGIPIDTADVNKSELANWIHMVRIAQFRLK